MTGPAADDTIYDAVIVGSGVTASLIADDLVRRGRRVCLVERGSGDAYLPDSLDAAWRSTTETRVEDGRLLTYSTAHADWENDPELPVVENRWDRLRFDYNMRFGYGGSGAVWGGHFWRMLPEDFRTRSLYGYGRDWPYIYADLAPYYARAEQIFRASGPAAGRGWPWESDYVYPPFRQSYLDRIIGEIVAPDLMLTPTADAVVNDGILDGGCIGAKTCSRYCPANAVFRPHQWLLDPLRGQSDALTCLFDTRALYVIVDGNGRIDGLRVRRHNAEQTLRGRFYFLCGNTVENLRLLLHSARFNPQAVCNSSGLLGKYFATHGEHAIYLVAAEPLHVGRGRPVTSCALNRAVEGRRQDYGSYMLEVLNFEPRLGLPPVALARLQSTTGLWGQALFDAAAALNRTTRLNFQFEIELRARNCVQLSDAADSQGVPLALVDFQTGERDERLLAHLLAYPQRFEEHPKCSRAETAGYGLNGNHPLGGYCCGISPAESVVDPHLRAHDHPNLYVMGGGAFNSTSCFNPTETIAAMTLRTLDDPRLTW